MASRSSVFPAFITDEYRPGTGFAQFAQDAAATAERARRSFETSFSEIQSIASRALSMPRNAGGSLDLGVGQYRQAAQAAEVHAIALREIATAAERAARANNDTTEATRLYVQAARAAAIEAEQVATASNQEAGALERVQAELNQTASRTTAVIGANRQLIGSQDAYSNSARASRFAMVQVGQQLQDVAIQAQMGTSALTILVQQGSQLGFAMSQMTGRAAAFGRFIAGPWGTAIFLGTAAVGFLTQALMRNHEAAHNAEIGATGLAQAQSVLGEMFDLTSGKLQHQNELLRLNARLTALNLQADAMTAREQSRATYEALGYRGNTARLVLAGHGAAHNWTPGAIRAAQQEADDYSRQIQTILTQVGEGRISSERALQMSRRINFDYLNVTRQEFQQAIINRTSARMREDIARRLNTTLDTGELDPAFRRERRGRQAVDHKPEQAASSVEQITRINEAWDQQPRLVDRAVQAVRELDHILAEAQRRKLPRFDEMRAGAEQAQRSIREGLIRQITEGFTEAPKLIQRASLAMEQLNAAASRFPQMAPQIEAAGQAVQNALLRPYRDVLENLVQQAGQQELISQSRTAEAHALGLIRQLEDQLGDIGEERRRSIVAGTVALEEQARQYEIIRGRQQAYLRASESVRGALVDIVADPGGAGGALSSITQAFTRLGAEMTVENLFGDIFRRLDDHVTGRDRVREENLNYATSIGHLRTEIGTLREAEAQHRQSLDQVIGSLGRFESAIDSAAARLSQGIGAAGQAAVGGVETAARPFARTSSGYGARTPPTAGASSFHGGYDFPQPSGTNVPAALSGRVSFAGQRGGYGNTVIVDHGNGLQSLYGHLSSIAVSLGQMVRQGQQIGAVGSTGTSTGNHLHEEFRRNGVAVDPATIYGHQVQIAFSGAAQALTTITERLPGLREQLAGLSDAAPAAASAIQQIGAAVHDAANDNPDGQTITITGPRHNIAQSTADLDPRQFARLMATELAKRVFGEEFGARIGGVMANALEGAVVGGQFGGLLRSGGVRVPNGLAEGIGALANNIIPGFAQAAGQAMPLIAAGMAINTGLSNLFGVKNHAGGAFGILGNLLINELTPARRGSATYGGSTRGNSKAFVTASTEALDTVSATIDRIAEAFGASVNAAMGHASLGVRDGSYRFDPTGQGITKTKKGAIDFGEDAAAAVRAAVLDLIQDGVIEGLRQGTQTLLKAAKDIDSGLQKALDFEGVFTDLKRRLDPVGAALDEVDKRFTHLRDVFEEAGASAEDLASLEQLYQLDRKDAIEQAGAAMTSALKGLLDDLTVNNDARPLRERLAEAHARYDPLATRVAAGDRSVDYDAFATAARLVEQLTRQIEGSTNPYFAVLDEITRLTQGALSDQENLISIASARTGPLGGGTSMTETPTVTAIDRLGGLLVDQLGGQLSAINDNIGSLVQLAGGGSRGNASIAQIERQNY